MKPIGYKEVKRRVNILRAHDFHKTRIDDWTGYVHHFNADGVFGGICIETDDVWNGKIVYFEEYIKNCVQYAKQQARDDYLRRSLYGGGSLDE